MSAAHDSLPYARIETVLAGGITDGGLKVGDQTAYRRQPHCAIRGQSHHRPSGYPKSCEPRSRRDSSRKGTFAAPPKITQDLKELSGFVEDIHALGRKPTAPQNSSRAPCRRCSPLLRRDLPALGDREEGQHQQS